MVPLVGLPGALGDASRPGRALPLVTPGAVQRVSYTPPNAAARDLPSITVGTSALPLSADGALELHRCLVLADAVNTATVWIGGPDVAADGSQGFPLAPGAAVDLPNLRPALTFARSTAGGQVLHFLGS